MRLNGYTASGGAKARRACPGRWRVVAAILAAGLAAGGCSASSTAAGRPGAAASTGKQLKLTYFAFNQQNGYVAAMLSAAQAEAAASNATYTIFDGNGDAQKQYAQIQDAIVGDQYSGFVVDPIDGAGLVPLIKQAIAAGIKVVAVNSVLGPVLKDGNPQIPGVSASVVFTAYQRGQRVGELVKQACASLPGTCQVGYMYDLKASGFDQGVRAGFDSVVGAGHDIKVVAEGQDGFTASGGLTAAQAMFQAQPGIDVMVGIDQGMEGATRALRSLGKASAVKVVAIGGSTAGLANVKGGSWFGEVPTEPQSEARVATSALIKAVRTGAASGNDLEPAASLPDGGLVTKANVDGFSGQWTG
jgi:ribose transport system substrate-binding protein